jgi:hypothetical protein
MQAVAEGEVQPQVAADVEEVGVRVAALVAVRRPDEQQHRTPFGDRLAVVLRILCDAAAEVRAGATSWSATAQAISARLAGGRTQVGPWRRSVIQCAITARSSFTIRRAPRHMPSRR